MCTLTWRGRNNALILTYCQLKSCTCSQCPLQLCIHQRPPPRRQTSHSRGKPSPSATPKRSTVLRVAWSQQATPTLAADALRPLGSVSMQHKWHYPPYHASPAKKSSPRLVPPLFTSPVATCHLPSACIKHAHMHGTVKNLSAKATLVVRTSTLNLRQPSSCTKPVQHL